MAELADIFAALGPAATPILSFLNAWEAQSLLALSKKTDMEVACRAIAYQKRHGFPQPFYAERPDGGFTLRSGATKKSFPPLKAWQSLIFGAMYPMSPFQTEPLGAVYMDGNSVGYDLLLYGPIKDIVRIQKESLPFRDARKKCINVLPPPQYYSPTAGGGGAPRQQTHESS